MTALTREDAIELLQLAERVPSGEAVIFSRENPDNADGWQDIRDHLRQNEITASLEQIEEACGGRQPLYLTHGRGAGLRISEEVLTQVAGMSFDTAQSRKPTGERIAGAERAA